MAFLNVMAAESRSTSPSASSGDTYTFMRVPPNPGPSVVEWTPTNIHVDDSASNRVATNSPSQPRMSSSNIGGSLGHVCRMRSIAVMPASHAASMSEKSAFEAFARMEERIETNERQLKASIEIEEEFTGDRLAQDFKQLEKGAAAGSVEELLEKYAP